MLSHLLQNGLRKPYLSSKFSLILENTSKFGQLLPAATHKKFYVLCRLFCQSTFSYQSALLWVWISILLFSGVTDKRFKTKIAFSLAVWWGKEIRTKKANRAKAALVTHLSVSDPPVWQILILTGALGKGWRNSEIRRLDLLRSSFPDLPMEMSW